MKNSVVIKMVILFLIGSINVLAQKTPTIVFEQTPCFGSCAVFQFEIFKNRKMTLRADKYMKVGQGNFSAQLKKKEYKRLINLFYENKFFEFKDEYSSQVTDLPSRYITFNDESRSKKILDYTNAPPELTALEKELFLIIDNTKWRKSD